VRDLPSTSVVIQHITKKELALVSGFDSKTKLFLLC